MPSGSKPLNIDFQNADARLEEDVAKGRRDWAYSERDKVKNVFLKKNEVFP